VGRCLGIYDMSSISAQQVQTHAGFRTGDGDPHHGLQSAETDLGDAVAEFVQAVGSAASPHSIIGSMHMLCGALEAAGNAGLPSELVRALVRPAYDLHGRSGFISRLQDWPRGYPGDYETIEWIASPTPQAAVDDPAYWLEWYALNCPIAQQHRNKLAWQRNLVHEASMRSGRILNVGCGGCADLAGSPSFVRDCDFTLLDMDGDALALASQRLRGARSTRVVQRDVIRGLRDVIGQGPYDLVLCGGLFDYLPDRLISRLLWQISGAVAADGYIAFTNISDRNPFRVWIENLANWHLIHRSEDQMREIVREAGTEPGRLVIERDATGLTLLCRIQS